MNTIIFLHIPKTAGTSLTAILRQEYGQQHIYNISNEWPAKSIEEYKRMSPIDKQSYYVIEGHWPVGLHKFALIPCAYITLLRNPVDRIVSLFNHIRRHSEHYAYTQGFTKQMSLAEFIRSSIAREAVCDGQAWLLSGGMSKVVGNSREDIFHTALNNLEKLFVVVGTSERFDESLLLLRQRLRWRHAPVYYRRHVAAKKPEKLSQEVRNLILDVNQVDLELHRYAQSRLDRDLATLPVFHINSAIFKYQNATYQQVMRTKFWFGSQLRRYGLRLRR